MLRHRGNYLQRRLTKLYSDTKTSCESVTTASRAHDDPELVALNRNFRTQKDRLLAWGLDWSDASAAQPNDIDESLSEAGFTDVVASVMSSIQELLNEAERLQHPETPTPKSAEALGRGNVGGLPTKEKHWTTAEISRSKALLEELTSRIDILYDLSQSRRDMSMSMTSPAQLSSKRLGKSSIYKSSKSSKDSLLLSSSDSVPTQTRKSPVISKDTSPYDSFRGRKPVKTPATDYEMSALRARNTEEFRPTKDQFNAPQHHGLQAEQLPPLQTTNFHMAHADISTDEGMEQALVDSFSSVKDFYIDRSALKLSHGSLADAPTPPPYEAVAASANSRAFGQLKTSAIPISLRDFMLEPSVPVVVEFSPMVLEAHKSLQFPQQERLEELSHALYHLTERARVSHLGLLKFLGYFIDMTGSRYAFVYQVPLEFQPSLVNSLESPIEPKPQPLVSLLHSGEDRQDMPIPNLENRFRLAYNLILSMLHLRSQDIVHGNINSSNIIFLSPGDLPPHSGQNTSEFRRPYLTSLAQFSSDNFNPSPEPLSSSIYRHPDDKRTISDNSAWAYDLYSLGLVLLEIGLWTPISRLWKMKYTNAMFKSRIENVYVKKLGAKCGGAYQRLVELCLDAPNFDISTQPMEDLCLRVNDVFLYPDLDSKGSCDLSAFSKHFLFTMAKTILRCCALDIVSPPPSADLDNCLPRAMNSDIQNVPVPAKERNDYRDVEPIFPNEFQDGPILSGTKTFNDHGPEKKVKKRTLKKWPNLEIPDEHLEIWNCSLMSKLSKLLQKILKDSPESCGASLIVAGETEQSAKTTICVTCTNVKKVRAALKKYFDFDRDNWDLIVVRGDITRSKVPRKRRKRRQNTSGIVSADEALRSHLALNPLYQQKPVCGASIGAFRNEEHLPPVSYGGSILVDGRPYGMTVHHMLDAPSDDEDENDGLDHPPRSAGNWPRESQLSDPSLAYSWGGDDLADTVYEFEVSDDDDADDRSISQSLDDDYWLSDRYSTDDEGSGEDDRDFDDTASIGDTAGIYPGDEPPLIVTQPAIDDVHDDFFPTVEDRDDEHLASHSLGYIHASSGVRRWTRDGIKHEVDWALIKMDENRMELHNRIVGELDRAPSRDSSARQRETNTVADRSQQGTKLDKVARLEDLSGLSVQCCGRSSGLQSGRISRAMSLVKMHGRQSFSISFTVDGSFGVPGDSGAWVFDKMTGRVCGHVLAWSEKNQIAYIAPMQVLLEDIARTLGATKITLPDSQENLNLNLNLNLHMIPPPPQLPNQPAEVHFARPSTDLRVATSQLPVDLERFSLEDQHPSLSSRGRSGGGRGRGGGQGRGFSKDVSATATATAATYLTMNSLMSHARGMERQKTMA